MRRKLGLLSPFVALGLLALAPRHDSEWPPAEDAISAGSTPPPALQMGGISISLPSEFGDWLKHDHTQNCGSGQWNEYPLWFGFGDLEGVDDGDLDLILYNSEELLVAGRLDINWTAKTGTFTPLWAWKDPAAPATPPSNHCAPPRRNVVVADLDGDGRNEVAFRANKKNGSGAIKPGLYVVRTPTGGGISPWGFSVPAPDEVASTIYSGGMGDRIGLCRLENTDGPKNLWTHEHVGTRLHVWKLDTSGASPALNIIYALDSNTGNVARTHDFNCADVDGDGYDEFMLDGVIDFVDSSGGVPVPTNAAHPSSGLQLWRSGMSGVAENHIDQMIGADFDLTHPGLEINSVPSLAFDTNKENHHNTGTDLMWDTSGYVVRDNTSAPQTGGQSMYIGNWSKARAGLETIYIPKGSGGVPSGETYLAGGYSTDALQEELTWDGAMFVVLDASVGRRAGGPVYWMEMMDWDGDYASDEILDFCWTTLLVFRMGEKLDWLPNPPPAGMPTQSQVGPGWYEDNAQRYWYWYENKSAWYWNYGGPGRYTHYFQKLGEVYRGPRYFMKGYDVAGDYREEAVTVGTNPVAGQNDVTIEIYYNTAALAKPWAHPSPRSSAVYRRYRNEVFVTPFVFANQPTPSQLRLTPETRGASLYGLVQLTATLVHTDGSTADVTPYVTWSNDLTQVFSVSSAGVASSLGVQGSSKITATLDGLVSNPAYLFASGSDDPAVLTAGYDDTYLIGGNPTPSLKVEARVAQRTNQPISVFMNLPNGTPWSIPMLGLNVVYLYDDGSSSHGDAKSGDGIYSTVVPGAGNPAILSDGDHLRQIQASLLSNPSVKSRPWPYLIKGTTWTNLDITGNFDNDAQGPANTPKIAWGGWRGAVDPNGAYLEIQTLPPQNPNYSLQACFATVNGVASGMISVGNGVYVLPINISGLANGTYIVDVVALAKDAQNNAAWSDHWPRVRVH